MGRDPHAAKHLVKVAATGTGRGIVKGAVLLSLMAVGIVVPVTSQPATPVETEGEILMAQRVESTRGPSLIEFLAAQPPTGVLSQTIAPVTTVAQPASLYASRDFERELIADCDPDVQITSPNGRLKGAELCGLPWGSQELSPRAALSLTALNVAFNTEFGRDLCISSTYRTLSDQRRVKANRGSFAAAPGTSRHGLGLAIDLCGSETGNRQVWSWLQKNGPVYGWANPAWARRGGAGPYEPWHWEFEAEVRQLTGQ